MGRVTEPCTRTRYRQVKRGFPQLLEIFTLTAAKHLGGWFWNRATEWPLPHRPLLCSAEGPWGKGRVPFHRCENGVLKRGTDCTKATQQLSIWGLGGKVLRPESPDTVL